MKTKQIVVRSAVTVVATGLTLLSSGNSQASGRGPSLGGSHGSTNKGAIHQGISSRAKMRAQGSNQMLDRMSNKNVSLDRGSDDRGRGGHERGDDRGGKANTTISRGEREPGDDHGRHRERGDDNGGR